MANNQANNSDEIDLGQLFHLISRGFQKIFRAFLKLFLYFKKNALILLGLIIVGAGIGYGLNQIVTKKLKTEVIVKPQMESKSYLYDVVDEIQANIKSNNINFFQDIGFNIENLGGFSISVAPVDDGKESSESEMKFLELLQSFENTDGLIEIYKKNAESRIEENKALLTQVDELISNYAKKMTQNDNISGNDRIVLDNQERINITGLFSLKNALIKDIESKKLELRQFTDTIKVINFGKSQEVQKPVYGKTVIVIPLLFVGGFFMVSFLYYLNRKSKEI